MKKFLSILSVITLVSILTVSLVACNTIPSDPEKAVKNLEENDFETFVVESGSIEARGFAVLVDGFDSMIIGSNENNGIIILYFDDSNAAKNFYEDGVESMLALFEISEEDFADSEECKFKQSGKIVYYGTEKAIKAAK